MGSVKCFLHGIAEILAQGLNPYIWGTRRPLADLFLLLWITEECVHVYAQIYTLRMYAKQRSNRLLSIFGA